MARWTPDKVAKLNDMYRGGVHSYTDMADELGLTKNAIAGKISRIRAAQRAKLFKATGVKTKLPVKPRKSYTLRFKKVSPAAHAHPLFRGIIDLMNMHQVSRRDLCKRIGCSESTFDNARTRTVPAVPILEAMYNVFGKTLQPVDIPDERD